MTTLPQVSRLADGPKTPRVIGAVAPAPKGHSVYGLLASRGWALHALPTVDLVAVYDDEDVVMEAVKHNGMGLEAVSDRLRADREVILQAVSHNGMSLMYASEELRSEFEVVKKAVKQEGLALQFADDKFRMDPDICVEACGSNARAMLIVAPSLREDKVFLKHALARNGDALQFTDKEVRKDPDLVRIAVRQKRQAQDGQRGHRPSPSRRGI